MASQQCSVSGEKYESGSFSDSVHAYIGAPAINERSALNNLLAHPESLLRWFSGLTYELRIHAEADLASRQWRSKYSRLEAKWLLLAEALVANDLPGRARELLLSLYQVIRTKELSHRVPMDKSGILMGLARAAHDLDMNDLANSYALLALIDSAQVTHGDLVGLAGWDWLVNQQQTNMQVLSNSLDKAVFRNPKRSWERRNPELGWLRLHDYRRRVTRASLPFNKSVGAEFIAQMQRVSGTAKENGDNLEYLVAYLFAVEAGFEVLGPAVSSDSQHDVIIRNRHSDGAISGLSDYILVECKNWRSPIDAAIVREFASRLTSSNIRTGVIVSRTGMTGKGGKLVGARQAISKEYLRHGIAILVLDEVDLGEISLGRIPISVLLLERFENVRFDVR